MDLGFANNSKVIQAEATQSIVLERPAHQTSLLPYIISSETETS